MKKNDWILGGAVAGAAVLLLLFQFLRGAGKAETVAVTVDGELYGTYALSEDQTVDINGTNRLVIRHGSAWMEWADCPDQICVNHSAVSREGESIICLPNKVVAAVRGSEEAGVDATVQ